MGNEGVSVMSSSARRSNYGSARLKHSNSIVSSSEANIWDERSSQEGKQKIEVTPSMSDQIAITKEWWEDLSSGEIEVPLPEVARFFVGQQLCPDV